MAERTPSPRTVDRAAARAFLRQLPNRYQVEQAILFGSRARGDHRPDSDLDLAVVLRGARGDFIDAKLDMAGIAFDVLLETGVLVQALPLWEDDLQHPEHFANPALIRAIAAEGIRLA
jgi:predicted nucleotidyltransferase